MSAIPPKRYFKIGEVSRLTGLEPHVIRYWEGEFPQLKPTRAGSPQRLYTRRDLDLLLAIQKLLYEEKYTIAGARKKLTQAPPQADLPEPDPEPAPPPSPSLFDQPPQAVKSGFLGEIRDEIGRIIKILD